MTTEYEAITEDEWKSLATTEITHLTDEEKDYLPAAWDEWIARVRRAAKAEALREAAKVYEAEGLDVNTESMPHHDGWSYVTVSQWLRARATEYETGEQA